ncbi:MAG: HAMP domain-containing histidine kinase [Lachnospiraceae bacterium]|nr:HAMP domain-containing histidine kinase [Lachnospiraceae bacterium]
MKGKIFGLTVAFILAITFFFGGVLLYLNLELNDYEKQKAGERAVFFNEITNTEELFEAVIKAEALYDETTVIPSIRRLIIISYLACLIFAMIVFAGCYFWVIKPFLKLERFAKEVARGNLDFPLLIERENIFGEFSWAFDLLRSELKTARENEEFSKQENKTLIATISHDIKTPVSSIRAYAEGLKNGMGNSPERSGRYLDVIVRKADEVTKLTNDLFLHALSDMEKLELLIKPHQAETLINDIFAPFFAEYGGKIKITTAIPEVTVNADENRLAQVFDNIITNAVKYAPDSPIEVSFAANDDYLNCKIRDYGMGIPPLDVPFIFKRFYRGANAGNVKGSGLGLYIVKYIIEKSGGYVSLDNTEKGLLVNFSLKLSVI